MWLGPDASQETPLQDTSFAGDCQNQDGVSCVDGNGYSMCLTAVDDLYSSTPTYFAAATVVHETLHNFGVDVATDHYGTEACSQAMTDHGSDRVYDAADSHLFQVYNGICPFVYDRFIDSFVGGS